MMERIRHELNLFLVESNTLQAIVLGKLQEDPLSAVCCVIIISTIATAVIVTIVEVPVVTVFQVFQIFVAHAIAFVIIKVLLVVTAYIS